MFVGKKKYLVVHIVFDIRQLMLKKMHRDKNAPLRFPRIVANLNILSKQQNLILKEFNMGIVLTLFCLEMMLMKLKE